MIRAGVVGVSGYSGALTLEILLKHPQVRVTYAAAQTTSGPIGEVWPRVSGRTNLTCEIFDLKKAIVNADVFFLAVPHTTAMAIVPGLLKAGKKVIDLSADYRLPSASVYKKWYEHEHSDAANLKHAVYGLPELHREDIKKATLIANPGCYPTAAILGLAPLVTTQAPNIGSIVIDAKSGVSGAGKKLTANLMFTEVNENFKAYKVLRHQHSPEINLYLSRIASGEVTASFVAHLLPINQGILETIYIHLKDKVAISEVEKIYKKFYKTEPFVRVLKAGIQPEVKNVVGTNYCDIGMEIDEAGKLLVITSVIDNLYKGAAGQAVQNFNIMCGFKEDEALQ